MSIHNFFLKRLIQIYRKMVEKNHTNKQYNDSNHSRPALGALSNGTILFGDRIMTTYDAVIIGTGTAGQTAAYEISDQGYRTAVIEKSNEPGGICALHGCQSKKYFYEAAEAVARCRHLSGRGIVGQPEPRWGDILTEKNKFTGSIPENTVKGLKSSGIDYIEGSAVFTGPTTLNVGGKEIQSRFVIIASGSVPMTLPIEGKENMITSNEFLALKQLPQRIAFVGGGFISFEFAHFAARLGSSPGQIYILEAMKNVLGPFDSDMVQQLTDASQEEGINIQTDVKIVEIVKKENHFEVISDSGSTIEADLVVNGAGRRPDIGFLDLETAGVDYSRTGIHVDSFMRTSNPNIFAVGDCASTIQLARVADIEAKTAALTVVNALEEENDDSPPGLDYSSVPAVLFTYPQLGMVGKTEDQLQQENIKYWKSTDTNLSWPTYRRIGMRHAAYKILVDSNNHILGAHFVSDNTTGMVNTFAQAMRAGITVDELHVSSILTPYPSRESDILYMLSSLVE